MKLEWSVTSEDGRVLDLSVAGVLATSAHGLNLVLHPNQLRAGFSYRFRLSGEDQSAQTGYSEQALFIKSSPIGGVIKTEPRTGTSARLCRVSCVVRRVSCGVWHDVRHTQAWRSRTRLVWSRTAGKTRTRTWPMADRRNHTYTASAAL